MPAAPSSLTHPAIGQLLTTAQALGSGRTRLPPVLAAVPDPRARRGVRHRLTVILGLAVCAVLAGARSFTAIAEWAADADQGTREVVGVDIDYESVGDAMLMVSASGTAVKLGCCRGCRVRTAPTAPRRRPR